MRETLKDEAEGTMEESEAAEPELEVTWQQHSPEEWTAIIVDHGTHRQWEVCSVEEFAVVIQMLAREP
jgi:hypothetical protein